MTLSVGTALPDVNLMQLGDKGPQRVSLHDLLKGKKVALFALPGAYTGTCTTAHVPSFMRTKADFDAKGVDHVICVTVNDPFVTDAWAKSTGADKAGLIFLADPEAAFTKAVGMDFSAPPVGLIDRSKRYALYADDGVVKTVLVDDNPGECNLSAGESLLEKI